MSRHESKNAAAISSDLTSAGVSLSVVQDIAIYMTEWIDGRHGPSMQALPSTVQTPVPAVLYALPCLHEGGQKAAYDHYGAKCRLANCRPGAWLSSPLTGWRWAKWPTGEVGWIPPETRLPASLRVRSRDDIH